MKWRGASRAAVSAQQRAVARPRALVIILSGGQPRAARNRVIHNSSGRVSDRNNYASDGRLCAKLGP
jgi:hypothetical protein